MQYLKYIKTTVVLTIGTLFLMGDMPICCEPPPDYNLSYGYLTDSPIEGMNYYCNYSSFVSETDYRGKFTCDTNSSILFKVGKLEIGEIKEFKNGMKIYPQDLLGISREDFTDERLILLTRFLQSLDDDGNITNSIKITKEVKESFSISQFSDMSIEDINNSLNKINKRLVNKVDAITHLKNSLNRDKNITN